MGGCPPNEMKVFSSLARTPQKNGGRTEGNRRSQSPDPGAHQLQLPAPQFPPAISDPGKPEGPRRKNCPSAASLLNAQRFSSSHNDGVAACSASGTVAGRQ